MSSLQLLNRRNIWPQPAQYDHAKLAILGVAGRDFGALAAILSKVGVAEINADFATFFRTIVAAVMLTAPRE